MIPFPLLATAPTDQLPASKWRFLSQLWAWLCEHPEVALYILTPIATFAALRYGVWRLKSWPNRTAASVLKKWRRTHRRRWRHLRICCLNDYIEMIAILRDEIEERCSCLNSASAAKKATDKFVPVVFVFTRQLPSDWPLWGSEDSPNHKADTPLEIYVRGFFDFVKRNPRVQLRRVIVIDNAGSPLADRKLKRLQNDIAHKGFRRYLEKLHKNDESNVWIWRYDRPWPAWLTDTVFLGVLRDGAELHDTEWYWAVSSSYDAQEDLIVLQLHAQLKRQLEQWRPLPAAKETLSELASLLAIGDHDGLIGLGKFRTEIATVQPIAIGASGTSRKPKNTKR